jgi:hypothetical protein
LFGQFRRLAMLQGAARDFRGRGRASAAHQNPHRCRCIAVPGRGVHSVGPLFGGARWRRWRDVTQG